jgi:GNAT superfamily N-acetyltransferase
MASELIVERLRGPQITPWLNNLADLRMRVFREFPYLYQGTREAEARYLAHYAGCEESTLVLARRGDLVVGASTAMPLYAESGVFRAPFEAELLPVSDYYYLAESVVLPEYRGLGLGHRFFDEREAAANELNYPKTTFCAVMRSTTHPARPKHARELGRFWHKRGYRPRPELVTELPWLEVEEASETPHLLMFWSRGDEIT